MSSASPPSSDSSEPARPSGRKGSRKVRTGCITCKIRKVKCDEGKPFCLRCVKTGRKCDGYVAAKLAQPGRMNLSLSPSPDFESADEFRSFDYYRIRSASALGGGVDGEFWGGSVLRLSLTEPAVRHAVLALSSLHEYVNVKSDTGREIGRKFAYVEYGKAISAMRRWDSHGEPAAIPLLVCVLFTCIEFLLGHESASQLHICQGRQVLSDLEQSQSPSFDMIKQELVPIYARLSLASFLFASYPASIPEHLRVAATIPAEFSSFREARNHLYHLLDEGLYFTTQGKPAVYALDTDPRELEMLKATQQRLLSKLSQWNTAFTVLTAVTHPEGGWNTTQKLLMIYYHTATVWVSTALDPLELAHDAHIATFAAVVSIATSVLNSPDFGTEARAFSFETELLAPIYYIITKCRHPLLRRAALKLLMRDELKDRKENLWYGREVIAVGLRAIELEEEVHEGDGLGLEDDDFTMTDDGQHNFNSNKEELRQLEWFEGELSIPIFQPPHISPPFEFTELPLDGTDTSALDEAMSQLPLRESAPPPQNFSMQEPRIAPVNMDTLSIEPPYNIPESRRLKNLAIGPTRRDGVWITAFKDPAPGELEWTITREFLSHGAL